MRPFRVRADPTTPKIQVKMTLSKQSGARCIAAAATLAVTTLSVRDSVAHIDLTRPIPREQGLSRTPNANLKQGPCGQESNQRTDKLNVFAPGETIEVTWRETTNHRSYYRIAFDRRGDDDFPVFAGAAVSQAGDDPRRHCPVDGEVILAYELNDGAGGAHTLSVTLPDVECDNCTLQVIQYMYDRQRPYYFQCADLVLRHTPESASTLDAGASDAGRDASPGSGSLASAAVSAAMACWSRLAPLDAGTNLANGNDDPNGAEPSGTSGGSDATQSSTAGAGNSRNETGVRVSGGGCALAARAAGSTDGSTLVFACSLALFGRVRRRRLI